MFIINKPSDLLLAAEQACNNEERLALWKRKKIKLAIVQRRHHIIQNNSGKERFLFTQFFHFKHH